MASACRYSDFNACPGGLNDELVLNTRLVRDGAHVFRIRVTDAAGNRIAKAAPGSVIVKNADKASSKLRLSAQFGRSGGSRASIRYGGVIGIRGRLTDTSGHAIGNGLIELVERSVYGAALRTTTLRTRSNGGFRYRVSRKGPSRTVRFQVRDDSGDVAKRTLTLRVRAAATLKVTLSGTNVRYRGRVASRPVPPGGKRLLVQGRVPGGTWQTFARRRTDRRGAFSGRYRLRVYRPGISLQFRVVVPKQSGYPYAAGAGRPVTKTVH